jgi:virulence-associated protein VapD
MAAQRRLKMINFDLSTERLRREFGHGGYRKAYTFIKRFFSANGFEHHQYSGYLSNSPLSYADVYDLVLDAMVSGLPWLIECVDKFDATNVTSQSNMLRAIKGLAQPKSASEPAAEIPSMLSGDDEIVI